MITSPVLSAMLVGSLAMIARVAATSGLVVLPRRVFTPLIPAFRPDRVGLLLSPRLTPVVLLLMMMGGVQLQFVQVVAQICLMIIVAGTASGPSLVHIIIGSLVSFIQAGLRSLTERCFRYRTGSSDNRGRRHRRHWLVNFILIPGVFGQFIVSSSLATGIRFIR